MGSIRMLEVEVVLWNRYKVRFIPHRDVNIIVGINGSGKTTLLSEIAKSPQKNNYIYIPSIDNLEKRDNRKKRSALSQELDYYIYDMKTGPSLMYYRMSMLDASADKQAIVRERLTMFCDVVNSLFKDTGKQIGFEGNKLIINANGVFISLNDLSSGEKQVLLLLLRVFLLDEKESIVLVDAPEYSLDISWQYKLIDLLVKLNPNAQFFITTHSPSIFGNGWGDKIIHMEDVSFNFEITYMAHGVGDMQNYSE